MERAATPPTTGAAMSLTREQLEAAALALPEHEREYLLQRLIASLDQVSAETKEAERASIAEAERRHARFVAGETHAVAAEEALARLRVQRRSA